jgi:CIC family chloride channel protein
VGAILPHAGLAAPSAAIVGMAAMVGAGTGGVMTAIVMVFEMTRDYAIIVPVIVGVAVAAGIRRTLIGETIYTIKLRHRGHRIPKERHINFYLVKQTQDIMEQRFILAKAGTTLKQAIGAEDDDDLRGIIVEREGRIVGLIPPRSGLGRESQGNPNLMVERFVESRAVICPGVDLLSLVFARHLRVTDVSRPKTRAVGFSRHLSLCRIVREATATPSDETGRGSIRGRSISPFRNGRWVSWP